MHMGDQMSAVSQEPRPITSLSSHDLYAARKSCVESFASFCEASECSACAKRTHGRGVVNPPWCELDVIALNETAQPFQGSIPLRRNLVEVSANVGEPPLLNLPKTVSPRTLALDNANVLEHP